MFPQDLDDLIAENSYRNIFGEPIKGRCREVKDDDHGYQEVKEEQYRHLKIETEVNKAKIEQGKTGEEEVASKLIANDIAENTGAQKNESAETDQGIEIDPGIDIKLENEEDEEIVESDEYEEIIESDEYEDIVESENNEDIVESRDCEKIVERGVAEQQAENDAIALADNAA